jgi:hypothetical protein
MVHFQAPLESTRIWMTFSKIRNDKTKTRNAKEHALELYVRNKLHSREAHIVDSVLKYLKPILNLRLPYGSGPTIISELKKLLHEPRTAETSTAATSVSFGQLMNQWIKNTNNNSNTISTSSTHEALSADSQSAVTVHNLLHNLPSDPNAYVLPLTSPSLSPVDSNPGPRSNAGSPSSPKRGRCATHGSLQETICDAGASSSKRVRFSTTEVDYLTLCPNVLEQQSCHRLFMSSQKLFREATQALHALTEQRLKLSSMMVQATIACPRQSVELFQVAEDITDWIVELSRYTKERVDGIGRR